MGAAFSFMWYDWESFMYINAHIKDEDFMFKNILVKFVDDERTTILVHTIKPKTKKKRIVEKWMKKFSYRVPDTTGCAVVGHKPTEDGLEIFAVAHPEAKPFMIDMNNKNDGNQPKFIFVDEEL